MPISFVKKIIIKVKRDLSSLDEVGSDNVRAICFWYFLGKILQNFVIYFDISNS